MTDNARSLSAWEANGTAGSMMAGRIVMCCRMCRWLGHPVRRRRASEAPRVLCIRSVMLRTRPWPWAAT